MSTSNIDQSGDGTRPTTDGGVDNIGAAGSFTPGKAGGSSGPAPAEKMAEVRKDKASVKQDDSAPLGLHESTHTESNTEKPAAQK